MNVTSYLNKKGFTVKHRGKLGKCKCPFHLENIPSFTIYPDNHYHCFSCGIHGTINKLVRDLEFGHLDDKEAWKQTFRFLGTERPFVSLYRKEISVERKLTDEEKICLMWAATIYNEQLESHPEAVDYLIGRGIPEAVILGGEGESWWPQLSFGYCPTDGFSGSTILAQVEKALGKEAVPTLRDVGIFNDKNWERFSGRVIIPEWRSFTPNFLQGRWINGKSELPYLFPPLPKPICFAEMLLKRKEAPHPERVWICEGIFDAISLILGGEIALCLLGVVIKDEILPFLREYEEVVLAVDADQDGSYPQKKAQIELPRKLWRAGIQKVTLPSYPKGIKDVNDWAVMWGIESVIDTPRREVERASKVA